MSDRLKEIRERHEIIEDQLKVWGGNPEPVDGAEAHADRNELLKRIKELEAIIQTVREFAGYDDDGDYVDRHELQAILEDE